MLTEVRASGVNAAAKKHKVPQSCASRRAKAAGITRGASPQPGEVEAVAAPSQEPAASSVPAKRLLRTRVARVYTPSRGKALVLEDAAKDGVTAAAMKHGMSRFSIYDWQRKVTKAAAVASRVEGS